MIIVCELINPRGNTKGDTETDEIERIEYPTSKKSFAGFY